MQNESFGLISRWLPTLPSGAHHENFGSMFDKFAGEECRMDVLLVKCTTTLPTDLQKKSVCFDLCTCLYDTRSPPPFGACRDSFVKIHLKEEDCQVMGGKLGKI